jgi:hypothetical protein
MPFPQHDRLVHKCFFCSLTLGNAREYSQTTHTLAPFSPTPMSSNTTYFPLFLEDYELDQNFELSFDSFKWTFQRMPHLLANGPFGWFWSIFMTIFNRRFNEWILIIVSSLFSYHTRSHSSSNCTWLWSGLPLSHDQTFRWNLSHCNGGNIVLTHKLYFMF